MNKSISRLRGVFVATSLALTSCASKLPLIYSKMPSIYPELNLKGNITTEAQALDIMANGGKIIFLGDIHDSYIGHEALSMLMPTLARAHIKSIALEFPLSMTNSLEELQKDISKKNLSTLDVVTRLEKTFSERGISFTGGPSTVVDFAQIFVAASREKINLIAVDSRPDDKMFLTKAINAQITGDMDKLNDVLFARDDQYAANVLKILSQQNPEQRVAIIGGVAHGCERERQLRLVPRLEQMGISVTSVILDIRSMQKISHVCKVLPKNSIDAYEFVSDVRHQAIRRSGKDNQKNIKTGVAILVR